MKTRNTIGGVALACALAAGCGGAASSSPDPVPTPTPAPAPTPTPTPNPGSIGAYSCRVPPSNTNPNAYPNGCPVLAPRFTDQVNGAIDRVMRDHPGLFNFEEVNGSAPRVLDAKAYHERVAEELVKNGVCTVIEKEELALKTSNDFNEQWNIYASSGFVRRRYVTTCLPSWF